MDDRPTALRTKLYRCLEIAMRSKDLECHVNSIIPHLAHCIGDGNWYSVTVDIWCDYFISKNGDKIVSDGVYPLTVVADRYSGAYSGGKWTAWNLYPWDVPGGIFGDDCGCSEVNDDRFDYNLMPVQLPDSLVERIKADAVKEYLESQRGEFSGEF